MNKKWESHEIDFLKENYPKFGYKYCSDKLGRDCRSIQYKCSSMGIKVLPETFKLNNSKAQLEYQKNRPNSSFKVNIEQFLNIKSKEVAYFLGYMWADGYIVRQEIRFSIIKSDMECIKSVLNKIGEWNYNERIRRVGKPICTAITSNRKLIDFLKENDFHLKSGTSACKILSKIPENLKHYFFRGLIDGDGHINSKNISISSNYVQDWNYVTNITNHLSIRSNIYRNISDKSKYSILEINGLNGFIFGNYIYQNINEDNIGLKRKYLKYLDLKNNVENYKSYLYKDKKQKALELYRNGESIPYIIKETQIPSTTLRRFLKKNI